MEYVKQSMNQVWASAGDVVMPDNAKIQEGWLVEVPPRQYWNWMQNRADTNLAYIFQRGIPEWDNTVEYIANKSFVVYNGVTYKAILTGTNQNPSTATTYWQRAFSTWSTAGEAVGGLTPSANTYAYFTGASSAALGTITSFARSILDDADATTVRTTIDAQQKDATLDALAGLSTASNKLPYFTGTDVAALTDLTAFGRSLIDDNNASDARTTLGLGTAATADVTTSATDATAGRLLKVGDFGVGGATNFTGADLDALVNSGFYYASNASPVNYPGGYNSGLVIVSGGGGAGVHTQQFFPIGAREKSYFRTYYTSWGAWTEVFTASNQLALGTTAASGRTALGLTSAATTTVQSSTTDATAGRLMTVGAFGLGAQVAVLSDPDTAVGNGFYRVTGSAKMPTNSSYNLISQVYDTSGCQIATLAGNSLFRNTYIRTKASGVWGSWSQLVDENGVTDGSSAGAGKIGEVILGSRLSGSALALTTSVLSDIVSINLTPGDWFVYGNVAITGSATLVSLINGSISTSPLTSGNWSASILNQGNISVVPPSMTVPFARVNVTSNTTVYLNVLASFSGGTCSAYGRLYARRER
jgi:hypothetical protein